ncbi:NAD(P)-dependent dehydrogenase (short-subunit alcohol dehydrogenase family) [Diaminobutyricimonas aerilata]|uniref:NAD(P)-dependent dehydrogenase (Short-subunit alcohol dehydrogenase family) n=1 Tax=Diaminobutyricimonas aerilata TaxID=1162967 RepID=A0A2M9CM35_9MICO|nr:SDR family NAD(P)-dependent oxidoreductase [Diaminobutyricimonas aerilata]PJJ72960.1 NAD(P)-dependent dehydrogenase (short-subunit alcohol dehydrogenase family) [Diaminobutyricimonas aerilata]
MRIAITGANAGIGLRAARLLAAEGHHVVALCRSVDRARAALGDDPRIQIQRLDLSSRASVSAAAERLVADGPLDALINNAAVFDQSQKQAVFTPDGHEAVWQTNHLGPFEFTARVSAALAASASPRLLFIASKGIVTMPRIRIRYGELDSADWYTPVKAYYHSKLAQTMTAVHLAELAGERVSVSCLRVPAVRLDADRLAAQPALLRMLYAPKNRVAADPAAIAAVYRDLISDGRQRSAEEVYVDEHGKVVPLPTFAAQQEERERLWRETSAIVGDPTWSLGGGR